MAWPTVRLADVTDDAQSGFASGEEDPAGTFQIRMNNITRAGNWDLTKQRRVPATSNQVSRYSLAPGDVVFNATNSPDLVGKSALVRRTPEPTVFSNHFVRLRPSTSLDSGYLSRWLQTNFERGVFRGMCKQWVNQATVGRDALLAMDLPLPPIKEQRRIADILDRADAIRVKRREALALLDDLTQSIFVNLFCTNGKIPVTELGEALTFVTSGGRGWAEYYADSGTPFIRSLDVRTNEITLVDAAFVQPPENAEARRTRVRPGDVLLTITGSRIGRCAPVPQSLDGAYISQHVAILRPDPEKLRSTFLSHFLNLPSGGQRQISAAQYGQTKPGLNFEQIRSFGVPFPTLGAQDAFIQEVDRIRSNHGLALVQLRMIEDAFRAIQQRAFAGLL